MGNILYWGLGNKVLFGRDWLATVALAMSKGGAFTVT